MWAAIGVHIVRMDHVVVVDVNANVNQTFVTWLEQHNYYVDREGTVVTEPCWEKADEKRSVLRLRTTVFFCFSLKCTET